MPSIAELRQEFNKIHADQAALLDAVAKEPREFTPEEQEAKSKRFSRMMAIKCIIEAQEQNAAMAFSRGEVQLPTDPPGKTEQERTERRQGPSLFGKPGDVSERVQFGRALSRWARHGTMEREFAAITTATDGGILLPTMVGQPIVPTAPSAIRAIYDSNKVPVLTTPTTAKMNIPVFTANAGGKVAENATTATENEPTTGGLDLTVSTYESGLSWISNLTLQAQDFDLIEAILPDLIYQKELGLEDDCMTTMLADDTITQTVLTATTSGITYANLAAFENALPKRYSVWPGGYIFSADGFAALMGLTAVSSGVPILTPDVQGQIPGALRLWGRPCVRSDFLQDFGANHVIGMRISLAGFRLRDAGQSTLQRYQAIPTQPNQTGLNLFAGHAFAYDSAAIALLVCPAS